VFDKETTTISRVAPSADEDGGEFLDGATGEFLDGPDGELLDGTTPWLGNSDKRIWSWSACRLRS